jgi:hypothetical protein
LANLSDVRRRTIGGSGASGPLIDQSRGKPHVGLHLRLIAQENACSARFEPACESIHFLGRQRRDSIVCHLVVPPTGAPGGNYGGNRNISVTPQAEESSQTAAAAEELLIIV